MAHPPMCHPGRLSAPPHPCRGALPRPCLLLKQKGTGPQAIPWLAVRSYLPCGFNLPEREKRFIPSGAMADAKSPFEPLDKTVSFEHTNWFTIREAGSPVSPQSDAARASVCRTYWYPLYFYVRRLGHSPEDAQDLTQEFFARL